MTRVLVADDHALFRDGLVSLLDAAGYEVVAQVGDGEQALREARRMKPELILLDLSMPRLSGHEVLRQLRQDLPDAKLVILTVSDDDRDLKEAMRAGANGYLQKSLDSDRFLTLLEGLQRGEFAMTPRTTARLIAGLTRPQAESIQPAASLTKREIELLELVEQGLSNRAIAQQLSISQNTVTYHLKNIFQKLGVQNRAEAVARAYRAGYLRADSSTP